MTTYSAERPKKVVYLSELSRIKMSGDNGKKYPKVIHDGIVKEWVGTGWVNLDDAGTSDYDQYPVAIED